MKNRIFITFIILAAILSACSPKSATSAPATVPAGSGLSISISGFKFTPASLTVKIGETVTWTNADSASHTVVADDGSFKSGDLATGASFSYTFTTAGTFTYICGVHPTMKGTIIVQ
jgi:plastocyanin